MSDGTYCMKYCLFVVAFLNTLELGKQQQVIFKYNLRILLDSTDSLNTTGTKYLKTATQKLNDFATRTCSHTTGVHLGWVLIHWANDNFKFHCLRLIWWVL